MTLLESVIPQIITHICGQVVDQLLADSDMRAAAIQSGLDRISRAINAQNEAHFTSALMALRDEDFDDAIRSLRHALSLDPLNAMGWAIYAQLSTFHSNRRRGAEIYAEVFERFGLNSPALPDQMRRSIGENDQLMGPPGSSLVKRINGTPGHELLAVGLCSRGVVASYFAFSSYSGTAYSRYSEVVYVVFYPWGQDTSLKIYSRGSVKNNLPDYDLKLEVPDDHGFGPCITHVTDRYVVLEDGVVIDLEKCVSGTAPEQFVVGTLTPEQILNRFGRTFGVCSGGTCRGVDVNFSQNTETVHRPPDWLTREMWFHTHHPEIVAKPYPRETVEPI